MADATVAPEAEELPPLRRYNVHQMTAAERLQYDARRDPEMGLGRSAFCLVLSDRVANGPGSDYTAMANELGRSFVAWRAGNDPRTLEQICRDLLVTWLEVDSAADQVITECVAGGRG